MRTSRLQGSGLSAWQLVCSALLLSTLTSSIHAQEMLTDCEFSDPYPLDANGFVTLEHYLNPYEGTFTMRVTYNQEHTWIGVGMNLENGASHASASFAVIGSVLEAVDGDASYVGEAYRYSMDSTDSDASGVSRLADFPGHLKRSSFVQNPENEEDEITVLEFTHDLVIRNENNLDEILYQIAVPSPPSSGSSSGSIGGGDDGNADELGEPDRDGRQLQQATRFIWAVGLPTNQWEGFHELHGSFTLEELPSLSFCQNLFSDAPSETPTTEAQSISNGVFPTEGEEDRDNSGSDAGNSGLEGDIDFVDDFVDDDLQFAGNELQDPVAHLWVSSQHSSVFNRIFEASRSSILQYSILLSSCITAF